MCVSELHPEDGEDGNRVWKAQPRVEKLTSGSDGSRIKYRTPFLMHLRTIEIACANENIKFVPVNQVRKIDEIGERM
jgi:hypothetical protein